MISKQFLMRLSSWESLLSHSPSSSDSSSDGRVSRSASSRPSGQVGSGGILDRNAYLALVTIHGTIMVFFGKRDFGGTFPTCSSCSDWGTRHGVGFPEHAQLLVLPRFQFGHGVLLFVEVEQPQELERVPAVDAPAAMPGSGTGMTPG